MASSHCPQFFATFVCNLQFFYEDFIISYALPEAATGGVL